MSAWQWADSGYLSLLLLIPIFFGMAYVWGQRRYQLFQKTFGAKVLPFLMNGISFKKYQLKLLIVTLALIPLILSLARPQFGESKESIKSMGVELMILFDVSQSMLSEDVTPNRLEFAKHEVNRFLDQIPGSKVGLVAFAGSAALVSPITTDASAMKMFIESLTTETISTQGTEFKMALEQADAAFQRGTQGDSPQSKVTKVILIISDGEDQEPGAIEAAEALTKNGIRIFSVSVGTEKGGNIPLRDSNGFLRGYKKNSAGEVIVTTSRGDVLKSLAKAGKGSFYTASFGGTYLKNLVEDLNKLEKTEFDSKTLINFQERYQLFLLIGILLLMVDLFLNLKRTASREWRGRFEEGSR